MAIDPRSQELRQLRQALRKLYVSTGLIDNGTCALCGGHRLWSPGPAAKGPLLPDPCQNADCPSHEIERLLRTGRRRRDPAPRIELAPCPPRERPSRSRS